MPYLGLLYPKPLWQAIADPYLRRRHSHTVLAQSLWGLWVLVCTRFVWALWESLAAISPLLPSCQGFSFALGHGVSFFGGIQRSPVDGCSAASCSFRVLTGEDEHTSFHATILQIRLTHMVSSTLLSECISHIGTLNQWIFNFIDFFWVFGIYINGIT